jgi:hypothetical protein
MSEQEYYRGEKDEKEEEKQHEKEEKETQEKRWDEKWRRDPLGAAVWAAILIWAGLVLLAENLGFLSTLFSSFPFRRPGVWDLIPIGAGLIIFLEVLIRLAVPAYRRPVTGSLIFALVLLGAGLSGWIGAGIVWAVVLIAIGLTMLLRGLAGRR